MSQRVVDSVARRKRRIKALDTVQIERDAFKAFWGSAAAASAM